MLEKTYRRIAKTLISISIGMTIVLLIFVIFISTWTVANQISQPETINAVKARLELFIWEHNHLNFSTTDLERNTDPLKILDSGKGKCGEFAILYAALCKSQGYDCRIVVNIFGDHEWTQVKVGNQWIHFDPSLSVDDSRITDPYTYERDWKSPPILALAFNNDSVTDVTSTYHQGVWINLFSIEGFCYASIILLIVVMVLTHLWTREYFYGIYFGQHNRLIRMIAGFYQASLRAIYIIRFVLIFFLPLATGVIISPLFAFSTNQDFFINTLVMGLALVTFSVVEFPSLTQPHVFISK